jgi:hypothetical protein
MSLAGTHGNSYDIGTAGFRKSATLGKSSTYVQLANDAQATFIIKCGTMAQTMTFLAYQSTTSSGGSAIPTANGALYQKATTGVIDLSELDAAPVALPVAGITMTASTDNYKILVITVKAQNLSAGYKWVGIVSTATSGNNYADITAVVSDARFGQQIPPSVQ